MKTDWTLDFAWWCRDNVPREVSDGPRPRLVRIPGTRWVLCSWCSDAPVDRRSIRRHIRRIHAPWTAEEIEAIKKDAEELAWTLGIRQRIVLKPDEYDRVVKLIEDPPEPTQALIDLFKRG